MPQKKNWTEQEDQVLRRLFEEQKISKWSKIAQKMADQYKMTGRNGKQCRESVLEPSFFHLSWTEEQEKQMYMLHNELGNKWAQIAQRMPGRTDNCVKNHFYSNFRKAIRKLNKIITENFKSQIKQIRPIVLYKIIQATDEHFKLAPSVRDSMSFNCASNSQSKIGIKSKLLEYSSDNCQFQNDLFQLKQLAQEIQTFSKDYKRKPKKDRRGVAQSLNLMKVPKIDKFKCASDVEDDSDMSMEVSERDSIHIGQQNIEEQQKKPLLVHKLKEVIEVSKNSLRMSKQQEQPQNKGIQLMLKNAGILFDGNQSGYNPFFKQSISQSNVSDIRQKNQDFNLGQSMQKFKHSFIIRQSGEIDQDLRLFQST